MRRWTELVETANGFLTVAPDDCDRLRFAGDAYADASDRLMGLLSRHLDDEEDLIVPLDPRPRRARPRRLWTVEAWTGGAIFHSVRPADACLACDRRPTKNVHEQQEDTPWRISVSSVSE